ncbi:carbon monoxide dehydrogenase medium chain CoxM domain protein [Mycobacterium kansasii]|uniref:Carbon monoxide dehydrogenase medium chain CoxM domain protein n=1 Tax=Mycobacterium kansasii TaxID=1768 RepID=A0A1V3WJP2_MYCKA|nr:carbon monoxide dehydrogenase medium chain CoxM domain protein [Mycobacterium kansasii]
MAVTAVERELQGRPIDAGLFRRAGELSVAGAQPLRENGFKVELLQRTVERQLATVAAMP